ncbi:MAG: EAL domain-containing protein [Succinivibrio sp.]|nr:EAL domain-containing protein [Succinivibrio sp.]
MFLPQSDKCLSPYENNKLLSNHFFSRADEWLGQLTSRRVAIVAADLNYFKLFNDIYGRGAGDCMLRNLSDLMNNKARELHGIAGYLGGDNFCMVVPYDESFEQSEFKKEIENISTHRSFVFGFSPVLGVCHAEAEADSGFDCICSLYDKALTALNEIRGSYRCSVSFYDPVKFRQLRNTQILMARAATSLKKGEFLFYVQPKVDIRTGEIISTKALVRWIHGGYTLSPALFIEQMEQNGYIFALDKCIWEQVCRWQRSLLDRKLPVLPCSVNVSRSDFALCRVDDYFKELLKKYRLDSSLICIEITESAYAAEDKVIHQTVKRLHELGIRVLLDDFGSGYSSLAMLHDCCIDTLKIDKSLVDSIEKGTKERTLLDSVINMAHLLGMHVIAEGVENEEQQKVLKEINCNFIQGFYSYRPMPIADFENILAGKKRISTSQNSKVSPPAYTDIHRLLGQGMVQLRVLDRMLGPIAVFEKKAGRVGLVQMNTQYADLTGICADHLSPENWDRTVVYGKESLMQAFSCVDENGISEAKSLICCRMADGSLSDIMMRIYPLDNREQLHFYLVKAQRVS